MARQVTMNESGWPKVQVALDVLTVDDALRIGSAAYRAGVEWVEAGTPLVKSMGMESVRRLKKALPNATIVADMKTLDAGTIEAEMAYDAGADVVSMSGLSHDRTVLDAAKVRDKFDRKLMVDLLMVSSPARRARVIERLGADIACLHTGIDMQRETGGLVQISPSLRKTVELLKIPVAAAGGVNPGLAPKLVEAGVKIVIVGGWITGSKNPEEAARKIVDSLR